MKLSEIVSRYDERLRTEDYADVDASANGLQVGPDEREVTHVAFAVDAVAETAAAAADVGADLLVTHHGLSWGGIERVTGRQYGRVAPLIENDVALYVSHLPLDGHPELGNAAGVADLLDLDDVEGFGAVGPETVGLRGRADGLSRAAVHDTLSDELDHGGTGVRCLDFGPETVEDVAVLTGAGADFLDEAVAAGVDTFVTGEPKGKTYHEAKEAGINVFCGTHYGTETFGVRSLLALADSWGVETTYLDVPTGL
ncbi:dinuclear metal center YbgI/SA1388 family protein [Halarchaeum rubridurum]|uniref:Dinuclear metal center YbgI/SA1388 family protein n=1 Tax=Halarchaeum rubridurum TaxID=489911 RepID=A0A830FXN4_9EURY|nr:Nif3-like dinuclear metal center hexameric protein [Halarchaeum rubridurum]MBP1953859.1 dinuclear metal center YbgI/SA1388 family protein [Halarchaeum rubridurum]GGM55384.1 Nif3-like dinuclear metal center hexameric protein [Halarchaeum rubridurum]